MTEYSERALENLRNANNFEWGVVPLMIFVAYIYLNEAEKRNWSAVYLGIAMWGFELIWEMVNGLVLYFSNFAPMWSTPGHTSFLIYVGLPIEIALFFAVGGLVLIKALPPDKNLRIAGIPNRFLIPASGALAATLAEAYLNKLGVLGWDRWWWGWPHLYVIFINYCLPAYGLVYLHDRLKTMQKMRLATALVILAGICHLIFATWLKWV